MSLLLPAGIEHLGDCPFTLHQAVVDALRILSYEEFPVEERPPRRIWQDGEKLGQWWAKVDADRRAKYGVGEEEGDGDFQENALELIARG